MLGITDIGCPVYLSSTVGAGWYEVQKTAGVTARAGVLFGFDPETGKPLIDLRALEEDWLDVPAEVAKVAAATLTAAEITNSGRGNAVITYTGAVANLTSPTGPEILAAIPNLPIGGAVPFVIQNIGGTNTVTVVPGAGVTLNAGGGAVAANTSGLFWIRRNAAATVQLMRVG